MSREEESVKDLQHVTGWSEEKARAFPLGDKMTVVEMTVRQPVLLSLLQAIMEMGFMMEPIRIKMAVPASLRKQFDDAVYKAVEEEGREVLQLTQPAVASAANDPN